MKKPHFFPRTISLLHILSIQFINDETALRLMHSEWFGLEFRYIPE